MIVCKMVHSFRPRNSRQTTSFGTKKSLPTLGKRHEPVKRYSSRFDFKREPL